MEGGPIWDFDRQAFRNPRMSADALVGYEESCGLGSRNDATYGRSAGRCKRA